MFLEHLSLLLPHDNDLGHMAAYNVYEDMTRKLCNIWIEEFISSMRQKLASDKDMHLLQDKTYVTLLTQH